jgi:uncharacterized protein (DUF302 family)
MSDPVISSRTVAIDHMLIRSKRPFDEVRRTFEATVPPLDPTIVAALSEGDQAGARDYGEHGPKLSIFLVRDHGALLQIIGRARNALQYEIGNPLTASKMTRHRLAAALYAPLRVALYEDDEGCGVFEYDRPSALFGQFGDERVTDVGRHLDRELETVLLNAARDRGGPGSGAKTN